MAHTDLTYSPVISVIFNSFMEYSPMKATVKLLTPFLFLFLFQSCFFVAAYGVVNTVRDINNALSTIHDSMAKIKTVITEGENLNRAVEDGKMITTLAERIPAYIRDDVKPSAKEKIRTLSVDLKVSSVDLTENLKSEDLKGARKAYNDVSDTYNRFTQLMKDLSLSD
jgi:hypothetical protein